MSANTQLAALARPFPQSLVQKNPTGFGSYVKHSAYVEKMLLHIGPFDFKIVELIRGEFQQGKTGEVRNGVVGCLAELTVEIDGRSTTIIEVGDCEMPSNWPHDGARAKDAASDALKRCAARIGVGLHLYSQDSYRLDRALNGGD